MLIHGPTIKLGKMKILLTMPTMSFNEIIDTKLNEREEEGYTATDMLIWQPVYFYYETKMKNEMFSEFKDFKLKDYINKNFDLEVTIIPLDDRDNILLQTNEIYLFTKL